ncbi:MAG: gliding motility-associated C-terminal domain-containing protein [Sphingobacteriaceae bacterium]|nr:gliding motility-associated C-terminal domain-containing protein [Sphingobacteriaceae bacterium]
MLKTEYSETMEGKLNIKNQVSRFMKLALISLLFWISLPETKACTALNTPVLTSSMIVGPVGSNSLLLNMNSVTIWLNCQNNRVEVELICQGQAFPGVGPFFYTSPPFTRTSNPMALPQMTLNLSSLCQGGGYQFRWRETYNNGSPSPWSAPVSFTLPGIPSPSSVSVTATPSAVCFPQPSQLTSTVQGGCGGGGGVSYTWTPAAGLSCVNCPSPVATPSTTTTYTLLVAGNTPGSCWSASTQITIVAFTVVPTVGTASAIPSICEGQTNQISISSSSGARQWEFATNGGGPWAPIPGETGTTVVTSTLTQGNYCYRLVTTGCGGTVASTPVCFVVNPSPTISVASTSICQGATVTVNGVGANSFVWSLGIGQTGPTTGTANPPVTSAYTATGTTNGCTATAAFNISVTPYPVVNLNSNSPVCIGGTINLNTTGTSIYQWSGPNGFVSAVQSPTIGGAVPQMSGVYNVNVIDNTCATTGSILVTVLNPQVTANNSGTYCAGENAQLFANGTQVTTYNWVGPGFASNAQNPIITNIQPAQSGIYMVTASDGFCTSTATTEVLVNPLPNPILQSNSPICESSDLFLDASGALIYLINGPVNYTSTAANNTLTGVPVLAGGVYTVTGTDANGCVNKSLLTVTVLPLPKLNVVGDEVCIGHTASISATGGVSYSWVGPNNFVSAQPSIIFPNLQPSQTGSYVVTAFAPNGCSLSAGTTLTVYPQPVPSITVTPNLCFGSTAYFYSEGGMLYNWIGPNNFVSHDQNTTLLVNSVDFTGTYTLGVIDDKGCQGQVTADLVVRPLPVASITTNVNGLCAPYCASYELITNSNIQQTYWNMDNTGTSIGPVFNYCLTKEGSKTLRVSYTDTYGCSNIASFTANAHPTPRADFHYGPGSPLENELLNFTDGSLGPNINKWEWNFGGDQPEQVFHQNPSKVYYKAGSYPVTLIIENVWGCKDTITKAVHIEGDFGLYIPNVFTPDGDGVNDTFQPKGFGINTYHMDIFDRWGVKIFSSDELTQAWDGSIKGKIAKDNTFVYKVVVTDKNNNKKDYVGHVSLLK